MRREINTQTGEETSHPDAPAGVDATPLTHSEIYNNTIQNSNVLRAIVKAINKGTLVTGAGKTGAELKAIIQAEMNGI